MAELRFPSDDFPAPVGVRLTSPEGWVALPQVALPLAVGREVAEGEFNPNVIVVVSRIRAAQTLDEAHDEALRKLRSMPRARERDGGEIEVSGLPGRWVEAQFKGGAGVVLVQHVRTVVVQRGPVADLVQLTGTCTLTQHPWAAREIREMAASMEIGS